MQYRNIFSPTALWVAFGVAAWGLTMTPMAHSQSRAHGADATSVQMVSIGDTYCRSIDNTDMTGQDYYFSAADVTAKSGKVIQSHNGGNCCTAGSPWNGTSCQSLPSCAPGTEASGWNCIATAASCASIGKVLVGGACVVAAPTCTQRAMDVTDFTRYAGYSYARWPWYANVGSMTGSWVYHLATSQNLTTASYWRRNTSLSIGAQPTISQFSVDRTVPGRFHITLEPEILGYDSGGYFNCTKGCGPGLKSNIDFYVGTNQNTTLTLDNAESTGLMLLTVNGIPAYSAPSSADRMIYKSVTTSRTGVKTYTYQVTGTQNLSFPANAASVGPHNKVYLSHLVVPGKNTIELTFHAYDTAWMNQASYGAYLTLTSSSCH